MRRTLGLAILTALWITALAGNHVFTAVAQAKPLKHSGHHSVTAPSLATKKSPGVGVHRSVKIGPVIKHGPKIKKVPLVKHAPVIKHGPAIQKAPFVKHAHRKWRPGLKWRWLVVPSIIIAENLDWCHYHRYPVSGMRFHRSVECHQHARWNHSSIRYVEGY